MRDLWHGRIVPENIGAVIPFFKQLKFTKCGSFMVKHPPDANFLYPECVSTLLYPAMCIIPQLVAK